MGDPRYLSRAARATSSSYYCLLFTFSVTVMFSAPSPRSTPLTFSFLLLFLNLNITSKARYHSGARSEGCGLCSVPKRCETWGYGGAHAPVMASKATGLPKYRPNFGSCRIQTQLVHWFPESYCSWLMQLNRLRLARPCMQSYILGSYRSPHYYILIE